MNDFAQIVKNALEYYDENAMKNYDVFRTYKYYKIDEDRTTIIFFDDKTNEIHKTKYEVIGKYIRGEDAFIWIWGWSASELSGDLIKTSRKVLNYALDLDKKNISLKNEFITSRYQITSPTQIDIHIALSAYLSKKPYIYDLHVQNGQIRLHATNTKDVLAAKLQPPKQYGVTYYLILDDI